MHLKAKNTFREQYVFIILNNQVIVLHMDTEIKQFFCCKLYCLINNNEMIDETKNKIQNEIKCIKGVKHYRVLNPLSSLFAIKCKNHNPTQMP